MEALHPIQLEPMEKFPSSQPIQAKPTLVSTPIKKNPIENKEYLSFTLILKDDVDLEGGNSTKDQQESLPRG